MKYIVEFEDEPCMYEDEVHFYKCIQAPWWGLSEKVIKQLTPYQPEPDCVSRKIALDAFGLSEKTRKYGGDHSGYDTRMLYEIQDTLENLPAVQPDHTADSGKKVCVDTISRQAALKKLAVYIHLIDKTMGKGLLTDDDCMEAAKSVLGEDELPAVQPEIIRRKDKKGAWILGFDNQYLEKYYFCSKCGSRKYMEDKPLDNFCANCGADMREENES